MSNLDDLQREIITKYYRAQIQSAILGLFVFSEMDLDEIKDHVYAVIYDIEVHATMDHHRKVMKK